MGTPTPCWPTSGRPAGRRSEAASAAGSRVVDRLDGVAEVGTPQHVLQSRVAEAGHRAQRTVLDPATAGRAAGHVAGQALVGAAAEGVLLDHAGARVELLPVERLGGRVAVGLHGLAA